MRLKNEIGSFLELSFPKGKEYYNGNQVLRLNSGRAAICHATRVMNVDTIYLPYYQCETVRIFLLRHNLKVKYYKIDKEFNPIIEKILDNEAILLVNYFGIMSDTRMLELKKKYSHVIIDNSQAFFAAPIESSLNVYSARKFIGVPDGAYLIGENANSYTSQYQLDYSSDSSLFLLQRIEYGCEGKTYQSKMINDERIDRSDIKLMSKLTYTILDGTDYEKIKQKRKENFAIASSLFDDKNKMNPQQYYSSECIPMVYPLVLENDTYLTKLQENKVFQGHWWNYLLREVPKDSFEYYLSRYMIPITIDQRYGEEEIEFVYNLINE